MFKTILNDNTGIIHAVNSDPPPRETPYSLCGCVNPWLQFWGWELILRDDGTWDWEATDGG